MSSSEQFQSLQIYACAFFTVWKFFSKIKFLKPNWLCFETKFSHTLKPNLAIWALGFQYFFKIIILKFMLTVNKKLRTTKLKLWRFNEATTLIKTKVYKIVWKIWITYPYFTDDISYEWPQLFCKIKEDITSIMSSTGFSL